MKKTVLALLMLISSQQAMAKDNLLSRSEFLSQVDAGSLTFERTPSVPGNPEVISRVIAAMKKEFPGFKDEMFYYGSVKSNDYVYFLFFEWWDRGCVFGVTQPKKYATASSDQVRASMAEAETKSYEKVAKKYCEKVLGTELPDGSLVKIPGAIKVQQPVKKE